MGYASRSGRARTSTTNPQAHAICDRCGARVNHVDLQWQFDWQGVALTNQRILVCRRCLDAPQQQLRAIVLPADPVPIGNPRVEYFSVYESDNLVTSGEDTVDPITGLPVWGGNNLVTQGNDQLSSQATGVASGSKNTTPGVGLIAVPDDIGGSDPGLPIGYEEVPETGPLNGET